MAINNNNNLNLGDNWHMETELIIRDIILRSAEEALQAAIAAHGPHHPRVVAMAHSLRRLKLHLERIRRASH